MKHLEKIQQNTSVYVKRADYNLVNCYVCSACYDSERANFHVACLISLFVFERQNIISPFIFNHNTMMRNVDREKTAAVK